MNALEHPKAKHKCPANRFKFINEMQVELQGPNNSRINHRTASLVFDVIQRLPEEHRHWGSAIRALQLVLSEGSEINVSTEGAQEEGDNNVH